MNPQLPPAYALIDPRPVAAGAPYTFFLPLASHLAGLAVGDLVKLIFRIDPPGAEFDAERAWVSITQVGPDGLSGTLDNDPEELRLAAGDVIRFQPFHVIDVIFRDATVARERDLRRQFWERCLVDGCVVDGSEPVEVIYREDPEPLGPEERYPDSGWRIRGRQGAATEAEMDAREVRYVALGVVLNADDGFLHLVDSPVGAVFVRNARSWEFVAVDGA